MIKRRYDMKDEGLVKLILSDPDRGMRVLTGQYSGLICSVIRKYLSPSVFSDADIEDCAADTLSEAYFGINGFDISKCSLKTWLCMIAERNAKDMLRRYYKTAGTVPLDEALCAEDSEHTEDKLLEESEKKALVSALRKLPPADREIIVRKFWLSQPSKQIAAEMRMSVSNVDTKTHRAISKLRKLLEE